MTNQLISVFIIILSRLSQTLVEQIRDYVAQSADNDTLKLLDQNKPIVTIDIFYFLNHCVDRILFDLVGVSKRGTILDNIQGPTIFELESVHGGNLDIALEIGGHLNKAQLQYAQYESILNPSIVAPSVVGHLSRTIAQRLKLDFLQLPFTLFFSKVYNGVFQAVLLIHQVETAKQNSWDLNSIADDTELLVANSLLQTKYFAK